MNTKIKNNKALRFIILIVTILLTSSGCEKFLEEVPPEQLTTAADLSAATYGEAFTVGAYRELKNWTGGARDWGNSLPNTLEHPTGGSYTVEPHTQFDKYATNQVSGALLDNFNNQWANWYHGVQDCNLALQQLPLVDIPEATFKQYDAEVRALRAFYYFCIVRYWGDAVMITEPLTNVFEAQLPRTSLVTIYDKIIIPDLETAVANLSAGRSTTGRVTQDVARAMLADVYMTVAGYPYQEAATDTSKAWCVNGLWTAQTYPVTSGLSYLQKAKTQLDALYGAYSLGTYDDLHDPSMNNLGEKIFQAQYSTEDGYTNGIIQDALPLLTGISAGDEHGSFTPWIGYINSYAVGDKRTQEREMFFTSDTKFDDPTVVVNFDVPALYKYYDAAAVKSPTGSGLNWTHYRYAEILLNLTEVNWALRQLGQSVSDDDIVKGINEVRERAELPALSAASITLKDILAERAWELVFENKMLWDQRRTRKCLVYGDHQIDGIENFIGHQFALFNYKNTAQHLLSPIPNNEIINNLIIEQNFAYLPRH